MKDSVELGVGMRLQVVTAVALTAYAGSEDRRKAPRRIPVTTFPYIPEPVDPDRLLSVIAAMTRKRADPT